MLHSNACWTSRPPPAPSSSTASFFTESVPFSPVTDIARGLSLLLCGSRDLLQKPLLSNTLWGRYAATAVSLLYMYVCRVAGSARLQQPSMAPQQQHPLVCTQERAAPRVQHSVPMDESQPCCAITGEPFETTWDTKTQQWHYINAKRVTPDEAARYASGGHQTMQQTVLLCTLSPHPINTGLASRRIRSCWQMRWAAPHWGPLQAHRRRRESSGRCHQQGALQPSASRARLEAPSCNIITH